MGRKLGGVSAPFWGRGIWIRARFGEWELGPHLTVWPGPRPACVPSFILIHPTVWPQYNNVTDRQEDRQTDRTGQVDSIGWTVWHTVAQKFGRIWGFAPQWGHSKPIQMKFGVEEYSVYVYCGMPIWPWSVKGVGTGAPKVQHSVKNRGFSPMEMKFGVVHYFVIDSCTTTWTPYWSK